jgi:hypothetical protein
MSTTIFLYVTPVTRLPQFLPCVLMSFVYFSHYHDLAPEVQVCRLPIFYVYTIP